MTSAKLVQGLLLAGMMSPMGVLVGCQSAPPPAPAPAPDAMAKQSMTMRDQFTRIDPNARVGVVQTVLASEKWLAVGEADVQRFNEGDGLSIFDPNGALLAQGEIRRVVGQGLHVKYEPVANAPRAPQRGDFAMAAQRGMMPMAPSMMENGSQMQPGMGGIMAPMGGDNMNDGQPPAPAPEPGGPAMQPMPGDQGQPPAGNAPMPAENINAQPMPQTGANPPPPAQEPPSQDLNK